MVVSCLPINTPLTALVNLSLKVFLAMDNLLLIFSFPALLFVISLFVYAFNNDPEKPFSSEYIMRIFKPKKRSETVIFNRPSSVDEDRIKIWNKTGYEDESCSFEVDESLSSIDEYDPVEPTNLWSYGNYNQYLLSDQWNIVRLTVLQKDHFKCIKCGSSRKLQVHHKTYANVFFESNHLDDLETLCKYCHELVNHKPILKTWT